MTKDEIRAAVTTAISEVELQCGRKPLQDIPGGSRPAIDLDQWDSLLCVEATVIVETALGKKFDVESIFVTIEPEPRARSIDEIVQTLFDALSKQEETA